MAYMNQEKKLKIAPVVKAILKKYGVKGSLSVRNHSTLVLTVKSSNIDFIANFNKDATYQATDSLSVNVYHFERQFDGVAKDFLKEVITAMNNGNHDNSDSQSDYFDVGWYVDVEIGKWNTAYILEA